MQGAAFRGKAPAGGSQWPAGYSLMVRGQPAPGQRTMYSDSSPSSLVSTSSASRRMRATVLQGVTGGDTPV